MNCTDCPSTTGKVVRKLLWRLTRYWKLCLNATKLRGPWICLNEEILYVALSPASCCQSQRRRWEKERGCSLSRETGTILLRCFPSLVERVWPSRTITNSATVGHWKRWHIAKSTEKAIWIPDMTLIASRLCPPSSLAKSGQAFLRRDYVVRRSLLVAWPEVHPAKSR